MHQHYSRMAIRQQREKDDVGLMILETTWLVLLSLTDSQRFAVQDHLSGCANIKKTIR